MFLPVEVSRSRLMPFDKTPLLTASFYFPWFCDSFRLLLWNFDGTREDLREAFSPWHRILLEFLEGFFLRNLENVFFFWTRLYYTTSFFFTVYTVFWKPWIAFDALVSFWDWIDVNDKRERMENGSTGGEGTKRKMDVRMLYIYRGNISNERKILSSRKWNF